jgi:hypothetical protein
MLASNFLFDPTSNCSHAHKLLGYMHSLCGTCGSDAVNSSDTIWCGILMQIWAAAVTQAKCPALFVATPLHMSGEGNKKW